MGKRNTLKIEIRKSVHVLRTRSKGRCKCVAQCEKLLCHSNTKTLGAIVLFYTFSISLTFFNQRFIHVRNGSSVISSVCCYSGCCYSWVWLSRIPAEFLNTYLILDGVGLKKLPLSIAPLFTRVQTILELINISCRHNMFRKSVPMFDCPLAKEVWPDIDAAPLHLEWILMTVKIVLLLS